MTLTVRYTSSEPSISMLLAAGATGILIGVAAFTIYMVWMRRRNAIKGDAHSSVVSLKLDQDRKGGHSHKPSLADSLFGKSLLVVLTAVLSGILIPVVVKSIDSDRDRNSAIRASKAKLFDEVSETVLTYQSLILDVSWFGTSYAGNPSMQIKAYERYTERAVDLTSKWRVLISRTRAFTSPVIATKLHNLLAVVFDRQDTPMNILWKNCSTKCSWDKQHAESIEVLREANIVIDELADELDLKISTRK